MKTKTLIILTLLLVTFGCKKQEKAATTTATPSNKTLLSSWAVSNSAWAVRLDINGANLTGAIFVMVVKASDNSEVWCTNSYFSGAQDSGSYNTDVCTGHGGMSDPIAASFQTGGVGSYTKTNSSLTLCKFNGSCSTYY